MQDRACEEAAAAEECPGGLGGDGKGHQGNGLLNGNARVNGTNENEEKRGGGRGEMQAGRKRSDDGGREGKSGVFG